MVSTRTMSSVVGGESPPSDNVARLNSARSPRHTEKQNEEIATVALNTSTASNKAIVNLQHLPPEVLEKILGFVPHRTISQMRLVSKKMDAVCGGILNYKFQLHQTRMLARFQEIKAKMPRRESARRNHPLACESDIIETLHMRLTLLQMTFGKHIERKHCCFFPGEILDECDRILRYIKATQKLARPYKVTDELYDLSTMAMEYFKEHIEPTLPEIAYFSSDFLEFTGPPYSASTSNYLNVEETPHITSAPPSLSLSSKVSTFLIESPQPVSNMVLGKRIKNIKKGMKRYNNQLSLLQRDMRTYRSKMAEQQKQILDYTTRLDDYDKKNEETSRKFSTLLQELNKCKTELQYWRSKVPPTPSTCNECGNVFAPRSSGDFMALTVEGPVPEGWPDLDNLLPPIAGTSNDEWMSHQCNDKKVEDEANEKDNDEVTLINKSVAGTSRDLWTFRNSTEKKDDTNKRDVTKFTPSKDSCEGSLHQEKAELSKDCKLAGSKRKADEGTSGNLLPKKKKRIGRPRGKKSKLLKLC